MADAKPDASSQLQAGGGGKRVRVVDHVESVVLQHLQKVFTSHAQSADRWTPEQASAFATNVQQSQLPDSADGLDFNQFLAYMTSESGAVASPARQEDLSHPLTSYFISSSHNTYLTGNQLSSTSTTDAYTNVLLRGCRCVEIDVWDGTEEEEGEEEGDQGESSDGGKVAAPKSRLAKLKGSLPSSLTAKLEATSIGKKIDAKIAARSHSGSVPAPTSSEPTPLKHQASSFEPRVLHGYTLTREVSFRDVCEAIRKDAFTVSDLPLIISLEVHCNPAQQQVMVEIMKDAFAGYLAAEDPHAKVLPSPTDLKQKILIKVKHVPAAADDAAVAAVAADHEEEEEDDRQPVDSTTKRKKPSKIIPELSALGIYTRAVSFKAWTQPEATLPTHIFSLAETKYLDFRNTHAEALFEHNRTYLLRAYPSGLRIGSSNFNPAPFWASGAQIVALNWQQTDEGTMLNEGMFADTAGYVLKPTAYRPGAPPTRETKTLKLRITVLAAQNIPLPKGDKSDKGFHPYVKVEVHVDGSEKAEQGESEHKMRSRTHKSSTVDLEAQELVFEDIPGVVEELAFVRLTIRDDELGHDDLAAWACVRLDRVSQGYRFVHLWDSQGHKSDGAVLVKIDKTLV